MQYLVISDIHANWEALNSVLRDSQGQYDQVVCLGDLVGYGPDPNRVVDWARDCVAVSVRGNHDRACATLDGVDDFSPLARRAALWTHGILTKENVDYLVQMPQGPVLHDRFALVHGSPRDEDEYVVDREEAAGAFPYMPEKVTFFGHTHIQGGFEARNGKVRRMQVIHHTGEFDFDPDGEYMINPGSVGQPRDLKPPAAYLIYAPDQGYVGFHRVCYDVVGTQRKIRDAGLPDALADRLAIGK